MPCPATQFDRTTNCFSEWVDPDSTAVRLALLRVQNWVREQTFCSSTSDSVQLVLAEALNNVVEHANLNADQQIRISIRVTGSHAICEIRDYGQPDRSLLKSSSKSPLHGTEITNFPEGGFGIPLIQSIADEIRYLPTISGNHVQLFVPLITNPVQI